MTPGEPKPVSVGDADDIYTVDVDMFVPRYGAVYVIDADRPAVVDTGTGANVDLLLEAVREVGIAPDELEIIAPTHVHLDHAGGAGYLADRCPNADVHIHERGARHLADPGRLWTGTKQAVPDWLDHYAEPKPVPEERLVELTDGDTIDLGDRELDVYEAPGHAPHQAVYDDPGSDCVFVADAAGLYTEGLEGPYPTTPPPNLDVEQCLTDVELVESLDRSGLLFAHCGPAPTDGLLEATATALRTWVREVDAARETVGSDDVDAIVAELDPWPDAAAVWGEQHVRETQALNVRGVLARA